MRGAWAEFITGTCVLVLAIGFATVGFQRGGFGASAESYVLNASFRSLEGGHGRHGCALGRGDCRQSVCHFSEPGQFPSRYANYFGRRLGIAR